MSVLFITSTPLGDALLSTGALEAASRALPESPVVIACGSGVAPLFEDWPNLERILPIQRRPFSLHWLSLWGKTAIRPWEWVIDMRGSTVAYSLWAKKRSIRGSTSSLEHRVVQIGRSIGLSPPPSPTLHVSLDRRQRFDQRWASSFRPVIAIAPVAQWRGKEWSQENFRTLLHRLISANGLFPEAQIAVCAAPSERARVQGFLEAFPKDRVLDFVGKFHLLDLFLALQKCAFFIGNDSGLMHLAATAGIPTLGLFGPSREIHYAPYGPCTAYVRVPESYENLMERFKKTGDIQLMASLSVEQVEQAVHDLWCRSKTREKDHARSSNSCGR